MDPLYLKELSFITDPCAHYVPKRGLNFHGGRDFFSMSHLPFGRIGLIINVTNCQSLTEFKNKVKTFLFNALFKLLSPIRFKLVIVN